MASSWNADSRNTGIVVTALTVAGLLLPRQPQMENKPGLANDLMAHANGSSYPSTLAVSGPNKATLQFLGTTECRTIAEIGVYVGETSEGLARFLNGLGMLHLLDYEDQVLNVQRRLRKLGYDNVIAHGNSRKLLDSYNWSLMKLLQQHTGPIFDYVFIDGAHTWNVDGLTFFLVDRLLRPGGYVDFDDYSWSLANSPSLRPCVFPLTAELYTSEQISVAQVALIVDLLVKPNPRYQEVVPNKIYRKLWSDE